MTAPSGTNVRNLPSWATSTVFDFISRKTPFFCKPFAAEPRLLNTASMTVVKGRDMAIEVDHTRRPSDSLTIGLSAGKASANQATSGSWPSHVRSPVRNNLRRAARGRHRKPQILRRVGSEHGKRLLSFSLIGFGVFAAGLVMQVLFVQVTGIPKVQAYVIQLVLSVQVNFLANYRWTWGDRGAPFWRSCWRYNIKRLAGILLNLALYPVLIHFGMNYLVANAALVIALTPVNYVLGHFWTFATDSDTLKAKRQQAKSEDTRQRQLP